MAISLPLLEKREIEAGVLAPLIDAFSHECGKERTHVIVKQVIAQLAQTSGIQSRTLCGGQGLRELLSVVEQWKAGDALTIEVLHSDDERLEFNVVRCRFAEMYRRLGIPELGVLLSCDRDAAMIAGFNSEIQLTRTQTLMEGATHCDFRYRKRE